MLTFTAIKMSNVEPGKAKAAGIVGILILITALVNIICGCIYAGMGAKDGSGLWSGFGVSALLCFCQPYYSTRALFTRWSVA